MKKLILLLSCIATSAFAQTNFWEQTNGPFGGTIGSLAINANGDAFAGAFGGVFRSTDNGDSWQQINNGLTTNSFSQIQFSHHTVTTNANIARSVFAVDVDGDGDIDVLSASYYDNKIAWYENDDKQEKKGGSVNAWVTAGIGFGILGGASEYSSYAPSGIVGVNLRSKYLMVGVRGTFVGRIEILKCNDVMSEKALLFGVATKKLGPYVTIAIGISEVHGDFCQDFDVLVDPDFEADVTSPGFPIDIQVLPKKSLGLAFRLFANINSTRNFIGFTLNLAIGGLR